MSGVMRTQLVGAARRPARLLLTGLAMLVASFVVYATVLAQDLTARTALDNLSGTPAAVDLVLTGRADTHTLDRIRRLPGVAEAVGRVDTGGNVAGEYVGLTADPGSGPLAVTHVVRGRYPTAPGEIAVTPRTADRLGMPVGTVVAMTTRWTDDGRPLKPVQLTVTGLVAVAHDRAGTAYAPQATVSAAVRDPRLARIEVRLAPGASAAAVSSAVRQIAAGATKPADGGEAAGATKPADGGEAPAVSTGAEVRQREAEDAVADVKDLFAVVAMFVAIAVVAAALVATSTFRIVFAQRMRQLALLRTVGAGRGALARALAAEGALTGLLAGLAGVLAAIGAGALAAPVARLFGITVAAPGFLPLPALEVLALSVVVTVLAVLAPAFSAARVAPLEALRASSTTGARRGIGRLRWAFGLLLAVGAGVLAAYVDRHLPGPDTKDYRPGPMLLTVVGSGALTFFALMTLGPVLIRPVLAAVGWPLRRLGPVGRLAVDGVGGAPRRAAAVSVVVALGVTLVAGTLVGGASVRTMVQRETVVFSPADFEVTTTGDGRLPESAVRQAAGSSALAHVTPYRRLPDVTVTAGGRSAEAELTDLRIGALPTLGGLDAAGGSLAALGPGAVVVSGPVAEYMGLRVGATAVVRAGRHSLPLTVAAVLAGQAPLQASMIVDPADLARLGAPATYSGLLADAAAGGEDGRTAGRSALRQLGTGLAVNVLADQRDDNNREIDAVLAVALGLIGLTVLIAVVGVGTTTALSVVERVREAGLLRAVGLSRGRLRGMLTAESGLYGVIGAVIGLALGVPYAWLAISAIGPRVPLELPVGQLAGVFVALVAVTALAGVLPARRAARVSPVAALAMDG
jgi:putative ABC transport system permease protein